VIAQQKLDALEPQQMRQALLSLMAEVAAKDELLARRDREVAFKQALIDKLTHENAILKRLRYALSSEKFCAGMSAEQKSLLEETLDSDIAQLAAEIEQAVAVGADAKAEKVTQQRMPQPLGGRGVGSRSRLGVG